MTILPTGKCRRASGSATVDLHSFTDIQFTFVEPYSLTLDLLGPGAEGQTDSIKLQTHPMAAYLKQIRLIAELPHPQAQVTKQLKLSNSAALKREVGN